MRRLAQLLWAGLIGSAALPAIGQAGGSCCRVQRDPYTAVLKVTQVQTLADGTTITRESKQIEAMDSEGRRLDVNTFQMMGDSEQTPVSQTTVHDPVENTEARWDSRTKTARITHLPPPDQREGCWANDAGDYHMNLGPLRPPAQPATGVRASAGSGSGGGVGASSGAKAGSTTTTPIPGVMLTDPVPPSSPAAMNRPVQEDLGTDVIQGVEVHGYRMTRTIPAGQVGNDRPIMSVNEYWIAPSLGVVLRSTTDEPRSGKQSMEAVSLSIGNPDPAVFQPPEGYKVIADELHQVPCPQRQ